VDTPVMPTGPEGVGSSLQQPSMPAYDLRGACTQPACHQCVTKMNLDWTSQALLRNSRHTLANRACLCNNKMCAREANTTGDVCRLDSGVRFVKGNGGAEVMVVLHVSAGLQRGRAPCLTVPRGVRYGEQAPGALLHN